MSKQPGPLTDEDRQLIRDRHAAGHSCSAIARELGRATSTVSRVGRELGLSWAGSTQTEAATRVKQASNRERRAAAVARLYDRAERIMDRLEADRFKVVGFDKYGNAVVTQIAADAIPGTEERALSGMAINALVAAARLEAVDATDSQVGEARGILGNLQDALGAAYAQLAHAGGTATSKLAEAGDTDD